MSGTQNLELDTSFFKLLDRVQGDWALSDEKLATMLGVSSDRLAELRVDPSVAQVTLPPGLESGAALISIHRSLGKLLPDPETQAKWLSTPHPDFGGHAPIDVAGSNHSNLMWLSYYLDSFHSAGGAEAHAERSSSG